VNGIHDMGGMHGLGPIEVEADEPVFHEPWEGRVMAIASAMDPWGAWNLDRFRYTRESLPPADYLTRGYYAQWLAVHTRLNLEAGHITEAELAAGHAAPGAPTHTPKLRPEDAEQAIQSGAHGRSRAQAEPKFRPGDAVVARNPNQTGHTRLPRYARGRHGVIDRDHGVFVFADSNATGEGERPQHVYSVRFSARELWGEPARASDSVYLDLWDDHLDPA
jgi:nitrile hydratase